MTIAPEPALSAMLQDLSTLSPADRKFVLNQLGSDERERLKALIAGTGIRQPSAPLAQLLGACRGGSSRIGLTPTTADALVAAAERTAGHLAIGATLDRKPGGAGLLERLATHLGRAG